MKVVTPARREMIHVGCPSLYIHLAVGLVEARGPRMIGCRERRKYRESTAVTDSPGIRQDLGFAREKKQAGARTGTSRWETRVI